MVEAKELKRLISSDVDKLFTILREAGFHDIWQTASDEVRCAMPESNNKTSVMVKLNDSLYTAMFSVGYTGDLFGALQNVLDTTFKDVMLFVHNVLGLSTNDKTTIRVDPLNVLRSFTKSSVKRNINDNVKYDETELSNFIMKPYKSLIEEGISPKVLSQFSVGYDPRKDRIIFPHYDWEQTNKIVGIKGRTVQSEEVREAFGIPKYWNYISGYIKRKNLYGFNITKNFIQQNWHLILFEGEKSVLKEYTYSNGEGSSVALGGHTISDEQVEFILKHTPPGCEIVLAFDKDVMTKEEEGEEYIIKEAKRFKPFRKVSYIYDKFNLLEDKDSPVDRGYKRWKYLFKYRKEVN